MKVFVVSQPTSMSQFELVKPLALDTFGLAFETFQKSAFRLELLPAYEVVGEAAALKVFQARGERPQGFNADWIAILRAAKGRGAEVSRVRLVDTAWNFDYLKFEKAWGYDYHAAEGEVIRQISPAGLREAVDSSHVLMLQDFWLFDEKHLFLMQYDFYGRFLGVVSVEDSLLPAYVELARRFAGMAKPF